MMKGTNFMRRSNLPSMIPSRTSTNSNASDDVPQGWKVMSSRSTGQTYFLHIQSGKTQWEKPVDSKPPIPETSNSRLPARNVIASGVSLVGAGLTSMFSSANNRFHSSSNAGSRSFNGNSRNSASENEREGQECQQVFENERIGKELLDTDPKKYDDGEGIAAVGYDTLPDECLDNWEWTSDWELDTSSSACDKEGWCYGESFAALVKNFQNDLCHASKHPNDCVRRRRYIRYRRCRASQSDSNIPEEEEVEEENVVPTLPTPYTQLDDEPDPFKTQKSQQASGFRVPNVRFPHRSGKDNTKDYQHIDLPSIEWLVAAQTTVTQSTESIRENTANLEERIKYAITKSRDGEQNLQQENEIITRKIKEEERKVEVMKEQYGILLENHQQLEKDVTTLKLRIDSLKEEVARMDSVANKEQRALNAEMEALNLSLEEKAKALATARMRYKQDTAQLATLLQMANGRLKKSEEAKDKKKMPLKSELREKLARVAELQSQLEGARQQRLALEMERRAMFNQVVEQKADIQLQSKQHLEQALADVENQINALKLEQKNLIKSYSSNLDDASKQHIEERRAYIRSMLSSLKEKRSTLQSRNKTENVARA